MSYAEFREALAAFFTASLHAEIDGPVLGALAERVARHLEGTSEVPLEDVEDDTRILDQEPGRWSRMISFLVRVLDRSRQSTVKEKVPQLCIDILVSLLRRNLPSWGQLFQTMDDWAFLATLRHALSEIPMAKESLVELMAHVDSHVETGGVRDAFICAYADWALVNPALAMSLVDDWLAPEPWGARVDPSSIAMLVRGVLRNSGTDRGFRARILDRVKGQRRLHHWYLALHLQAYLYPDPQPSLEDRCSGLVSTVEKDPLNLAGEALRLLERHLLGDPEVALLSLDLIVESVHRETGSGLPEDSLAREIGAYLLEVSRTQRCPPVEIPNELLLGLTKTQAEVVVLELVGRAMSNFYVSLCLRMLSLQSVLRQESAGILVDYCVSDYPGACRTVRERSAKELHPEVVALLDNALQSADSHHDRVRSIAEIFAHAPFRHRWNARINEIVKAQREHQRQSGHHWLMSIASEVHLARSPRRWGVAGDLHLRGTKEITTSFEGSRLHCSSPLRYQQLRLSLLRRSQVLLTPGGGA